MSDPKTASRPPLGALRAFAAAARCGAFRDAAAALGVTPSAISHQIRGLERWIGAPLFERGVRHVRLTETGARLGAALNRSFAEMDRALDAARAEAAPSTLRLSALPLITDIWLNPRLSRFEAAHPQLSLEIETAARVVDLRSGEADVAIRNVPGPCPGLAVRKLLDVRAVALCAPELAERLRAPSDLSETTLIGLNVGRGWPQWLAAAGVGDLQPRRRLAFDALPAAIAAAAAGRGVILGLSPLIWDAPAAERLVAPFDTPPQDAGAYFVAHRKEDAANAAVQAFTGWLFEEMRGDARRLKTLERERLTRHRSAPSA